MTPRELSIRIQAYQESKKAEIEYMQDMLTVQAFLISRWVWQKRVDIDKALNSNKQTLKSKQMTDDEMLAQVRALNALFGGEVKIVDGTEE